MHTDSARVYGKHIQRNFNESSALHWQSWSALVITAAQSVDYSERFFCLWGYLFKRLYGES